MQDPESYLVWLFGFAALLITQTAALSFPNSTTLLAITANSTISKSPVHVDRLHTPAVDALTFPTLIITTSATRSANQSLRHGNFSHAAAAIISPAFTPSVNISTFPATTQPVSNSAALTSSVNISTIPTTTQALSNSEPLQSAAMDSPTPTTLVTMTSAYLPTPQSPSDVESTINPIPTTTQSPNDVESTFHPIPTTTPVLTVISDYKIPSPTPGSVAIINGIAMEILNDTAPQDSGILADMPTTPSSDIADMNQLYQPWNTSYPGPIHHGDWDKYLGIWDPVWWAANLDSIRQTSCLCSAADFYTNPQAQLASYMNFQYYSHQLGALYTLDYGCGPAPSSMSKKERVTSAKGKTEHCWQAAGGEFAGQHPHEDIVGYWCDEKEELCVEPWRARKRSFRFHGHERHYDRDGIHTYSETQPVVSEVCRPICADVFKMNYDDFSHHNPNFITTFYPPKPVDLDIIGD